MEYVLFGFCDRFADRFAGTVCWLGFERYRMIFYSHEPWRMVTFSIITAPESFLMLQAKTTIRLFIFFLPANIVENRTKNKYYICITEFFFIHKNLISHRANVFLKLLFTLTCKTIMNDEKMNKEFIAWPEIHVMLQSFNVVLYFNKRLVTSTWFSKYIFFLELIM